MNTVIVSGTFDNLQAADEVQAVRFLQEAARLGELHALVWTDELSARLLGQPPKFALEERIYLLQAQRHVHSYEVIDALNSPHHLPAHAAAVWAVREADACAEKQAAASRAGLALQVITDAKLAGFREMPAQASAAPDAKSVVVTGSFDWLHSGHIRFFEEVSGYGDLTVIVGHDANIRLLKGDGHPLFSQEQRLFMVQSVRYVRQALLSTGHGWLDAEPELQRLKPDIYAVNEDGDKPEKRAYCEQHGIEYLVLKRVPKEGLSRRSSTDLRGY